MSKLSRFKRGPVLKLPRRQPPKNQSDDDSDDDFVSRPIKFNASAEKSKDGLSHAKSNTPSPVEPSISKYIPTSERNRTDPAISGSDKETFQDEATSSSSKIKHKQTDTKAPPNKAKASSSTKQAKVKAKRDIATHTTESAGDPVTSENVDEKQGKVMCPFCWKTLSDKLTGTTHVKACAKDVPIQQIFEAMQLQEKQIQEWEKLGLDFPGFSSTGGRRAKNTAATSKPKSAGRGRKKKTETVPADADLELAVALSMSLHEELESRQTVENEFLIENGLEKEIGLVQIKPTASPHKAIEKPVQHLSVGEHQRPGAPVNRRRGKKLPLDQLPLYSVDSKQKKAIICERVTKILDESENHKNQHFNVREELSPGKFGVPKRLLPFQDKDSTLWTLAQGGLDIPNESFSTLDLPTVQVDPEIALDKFSENIKPTNLTPCKSEIEIIIDEKKPILTTEVTQSLALIKDDVKPSTIEGVGTKSKIVSLESTMPSMQASLPKKSQETLRRLPRVIQDITTQLLLRENCDMVLYGREEKAIKCHRFMLSARCPQILRDVVEEKNGKNTRLVVPLTCYRHTTVKAFLWYVYTGIWEQSYDEDLKSELKALLSTYGLSVDEDSQSKHFVKPQSASVEVQTEAVLNNIEVQTDVVSCADSSTMTDLFSNCSKETGFESLDESQGSQEMFTTYFERSTPEVKQETPVKEQAASPTSPKHLCHNASDSDNDQSDIDLFEDYDNRNDSHNVKISLQSETKKHSDNEAKSSTLVQDKDCEVDSSNEGDFIKELLSPITQWKRESNHNDNVITSLHSETENDSDNKAKRLTSIHHHQEYKEDSSDEDDFMKELASPVTQWKRNSDKKRSRSISPIVDNCMNMFSATQVASILQLRQDGGDVTEFLNKANKKQKLDQTNNCSVISDKTVDVKDAMNVSEIDAFGNSICGDDSIFLKISCSNNPKEGTTAVASPMTNRLKSRRSVSSPNISVKLSNHSSTSPFYNQQVAEVVDFDNEPDPFADVCDDSVFANIPEEMLMKGRTPESIRTKNTCHKDLDVSKRVGKTDLSLTPLSHTRRRVSPRDLSSCDDDTLSNNKKGSRQGRARGKVKPPPKIKLPSRLQPKNNTNADNDNEFACRKSPREKMFLSQQPQPKRNPPPPEPTNSNGKSPLLNYSLIDTPILKQELKRYGIKPLPRSKAKVLLRHIYKETHK